MIKTQTKVNFNFHKVTGAALTTNIMGSLKNVAEKALGIVKKTFKTQKDIHGKKFAKSTYGYLARKHGGNPSKIKSNKIMTDKGRLKDSIEALPSESNIEYIVGTPHGEYEKHLESKVRFSRDVDGKSASYSGYQGDFAPVPQRKFFFTSSKEAYEMLEPEIEKQVDEFFDEFIKNLSTSMRKLG
mgnify:CR=1 FL=1|jgi:hypothetical protein|tara:strand:+ start:4613 stop:5167 length:555 start_codon:yes stop_codon:yes gene_type:complete